MASDSGWTVAGAGLAGSLTCLELVRRGQPVRWISSPDCPPASAVAAGMYNPITGKRFARTWQVDTLQPFMETYYRTLEKETGCRFLFPKPVMKLFTDPEEKQRWAARKDEADFQRLAQPLEPSSRPVGIRDLGHGGFLVPHAGFVRVATLLQALTDHLKNRVDIIHRAWDPQQDHPGQIIHCTGWQAINHPDLRDIPFRHAHGDLLTIRAPGLDSRFILNTGVYILPLGDQCFRVGATYDWDRLDPNPTDEGRQELEARLDELLDVPYEVIGHEAGIRPATRRRTPVLGKIPNRPGHSVYNGLGSKGVLLGPYYARHLIEHLLDGRTLDREVDIHTHLKKRKT